MDPYLEQHWRDVHQRLITYICDALQPSLPSDLIARTEERVYVESDMADLREIYPDVRVIEDTIAAGGGSVVREAGVALAEPHIIHLRPEPMTEGYVQILDATGGAVICVIEVLSVANKLKGEGMGLYKKKQAEVIAAGVGLVEIDLLRSGEWILAAPRDRVPPQLRSAPYHICVRRASDSTQAELYSASFRNRLPVIRVPLRAGDEDVTLDLHALMDRVYEYGRYDKIDYRKPCVPPLSGDEAAWTEELLKAAGRRS
jgi:hypothetical protein